MDKVRKSSALTTRQKRIHDHMLAFQREHGTPPSYREVMEWAGFKSPSAVRVHCRALIRKGWAKEVSRGTGFRRLVVVAIDVEAEREGRCPTCGRTHEGRQAADA